MSGDVSGHAGSDLRVLVVGAGIAIYGAAPGQRVLAFSGMYVADDVSHILKAAAFLFTALARDTARGLDLSWVMNTYVPLFWPDLVLYFALPAEVSSQRINARKKPSYYEAGQDVTNISDAAKSHQKFVGRVIDEYEALAKIVTTQRAGALLNPNAVVKLRQPLTEDHYLSSRMIADPLRLLDSVMFCDGANAVLVTTEEEARSRGS